MSHIHARQWEEGWTASDGRLIGSGPTEDEARFHLSQLQDTEGAERQAIAELVRAKGCVCDRLDPDHRDRTARYHHVTGDVVEHDALCPTAIADEIEKRGGR